jgi:hypothetical protein
MCVNVVLAFIKKCFVKRKKLCAKEKENNIFKILKNVMKLKGHIDW